MFVLRLSPGSHLVILAASRLVIIVARARRCRHCTRRCRCHCRCRKPRGILAGSLAAIIAGDFATVSCRSPVAVLAGILAAIIACDFATVSCRSPVAVLAGIWLLPLQ